LMICCCWILWVWGRWSCCWRWWRNKGRRWRKMGKK